MLLAYVPVAILRDARLERHTMPPDVSPALEPCNLEAPL